MDIAQDIMEIIAKLSGIPKNELSTDTLVYDSTIISSLNLLDLMKNVENKYDIVIKPEELFEDNFKDIMTLAGFIERKVGERRN